MFNWLFGGGVDNPKPLSKINRKRCSITHQAIPSGTYPGLRNSSGVHCFLNSTIQSLASLTSLESFLGELLNESDKVDIYLPLSEALWDVIQTLNTPSRAVHTNTAIIDAFSLSDTNNNNTSLMSPSKRALSLIQSGQQDAQEMFQCISSLLAHEEGLIKAAKCKVRGLDTLTSSDNTTYTTSFPLAGLTASRLADLRCGYVEAIRNIAFDALSLNLPMQTSCTVEQLLGEYTAIETIEDASCRRCSLEATLARLRQDVKQLMPADPNKGSTSRRKRIKEASKQERRLSTLLSEEGDLQEDARLKDIKVDKSGGGSTKQILIARPPRILGLHINRSAYLGNGMAVKNPCKILFGDTLDITAYTTTGALETAPRKPISSPSKEMIERLTSTGTIPSRVLYTLKSIVVHYDDDDEWLRTSDSSVQIVSLADVLQQNPFMIFYERAVDKKKSENNTPNAQILSTYSLHD